MLVKSDFKIKDVNFSVVQSLSRQPPLLCVGSE